MLFRKAWKGVVIAQVGDKGYPGSDRTYSVAIVLFARTFHCTVCLCQSFAAGVAAALAARNVAGQSAMLRPVAARREPTY